MRKILLFFGSILSISIAYSQAILNVQAPLAASSTSLRLANGSSAHTTFRGHLILPASELGSIPTGTTLSTIGFTVLTPPSSAAGGTINIYLQNTTDATNLKDATWATAITGMTSVYNGAYNIPITAGLISMTLTTPFVYTGGGLYVAYDYVGTTFATTGATYESSASTSIAGGVKCLPSATTTPPAVLTQTSAFRPSVTFTFPNPFTDNLNVLGITPDRGNDNLLLGPTQSIRTIVRNSSSSTLTNKVVTLTIAGANPYTTTQTIASLPPGVNDTLIFTGVPKTMSGTQTLTVSVPPDQQTINDQFVLNQKIYCDTVGPTADNTITSGLGYNTGTGIFANLLVAPSTQEMFVKKVRPTISTGTTNTGNSIKGVLLNAQGVIIDSTASYTILASDLGQKVELTFINGAIDISGDSVFYGFRQVANAVTGYFPLATQDAAYVLPNTYFGFNANGGGMSMFTQYGIGMIDAIIATTPYSLTSNASGGSICSAVGLNLTASPNFTNYIFNIDGAVVQNGLSSTYSYSPTTTTTAIVTANMGNCAYVDTLTVGVFSTLTNAISAGICPGGTYTFGGQVLNSGGTYIDTITSSGGCDSVVTLTLMNYVPTSSSISAGICAGDTYSFGSQTLTTAGTYTRTIPNAQGCDSVITLTLSNLASTSSNITGTICFGGTLIFGSQTITAPGTYSRTIPNAAGCDSLITMTVTYQMMNTNVVQTGATLSVPVQTGATYSWLTCPQMTSIAGANSNSYTATNLTGSYAVVVSINGCSDTSTCYTVDQTGLNEVNLSSFVDVFPNPTSDVLKVESNSFNMISFKVLDLNGRVILSEQNLKAVNSLQFNTVNFENGTYILDLNTEYGSVKKVFIKQ